MAIRAALGARGVAAAPAAAGREPRAVGLGGVLGLGLAVAGLDLLIAYAGRFTNRTGEIALDGWVLGFTLIVSIAIALLFAWAPRLGFLDDPVARDGRRRRPRHRQPGPAPRAAGAGREPARRVVHAADRRRAADAQLLQLYAVDPGFDLANVLSLQAPDFTALNRERRLQFSRDVLERVQGRRRRCRSAAMASAAPLAGSFPQQQEFQVDGADRRGGRRRRRRRSPASSAPATSRPSARGSSPAAASTPTRRDRRRRRS